VMVADNAAAMLFAYAKNKKDDLSVADKKLVLALMKEIDDG
jgi:hypothetical protein